jgi:hypothetical protein
MISIQLQPFDLVFLLVNNPQQYFVSRFALCKQQDDVPFSRLFGHDQGFFFHGNWGKVCDYLRNSLLAGHDRVCRSHFSSEPFIEALLVPRVSIDFKGSLIGKFVIQSECFHAGSGLFVPMTIPALLFLQAPLKPSNDSAEVF